MLAAMVGGILLLSYVLLLKFFSIRIYFNLAQVVIGLFALGLVDSVVFYRILVRKRKDCRENGVISFFGILGMLISAVCVYILYA